MIGSLQLYAAVHISTIPIDYFIFDSGQNQFFYHAITCLRKIPLQCRWYCRLIASKDASGFASFGVRSVALEYRSPYPWVQTQESKYEDLYKSKSFQASSPPEMTRHWPEARLTSIRDLLRDAIGSDNDLRTCSPFALYLWTSVFFRNRISEYYLYTYPLRSREKCSKQGKAYFPSLFMIYPVSIKREKLSRLKRACNLLRIVWFINLWSRGGS